MARVVVFRQYGAPDVLELIERVDPVAGPGDLLVAMEAAGVQPFDAMFRAGYMQQWAPATFPQRLGNEFAGRVIGVGEDVSGLAVGDDVLGWSRGDAYAESIAVPAGNCVKKPAAMPWVEAGSLSASGQTASTVLAALDLEPGETLIVHAAAGGVGSMVVQLAVAAGIRVVGTASPANHDYLRRLGAEPVDYHGDLIANLRQVLPNGATAALVAVGGEAALAASVTLVGDRARILTVAYDPAAEAMGIKRIGTQRSVARLQSLVDLHTAGKLRVEVSQVLPLSRAAEAHRAIESGHGRGKIVVVRDDA